MELYDVVKKMVGPVMPIGETNEDDRRFENLKALCDLCERILMTIDQIIPEKERDEYSRKRAGEFADKWFTRQGIEE